MKKLFTILVLLAISISSFSQNISINATGTPPVASAILDVSSNTKGILIPRMTTAECAAIVSPVSGLLIYDTDKKTFMYYNGISWLDIASTTANSGWKIQGNSGTSSATNFIGTTDNVPLVFKTNNVQSGLLDPISANYFIGQYSGISNTGVGNVGIGQSALKLNTSGRNNTAIGAYALLNSTTGSRNTAVGDSVLILNADGSSNTAMGSNALEKNTGGDFNSAFGVETLSKNQTGNYNSAFGDLALSNNLDGFQNTAIGNSAVFSNTSGDYNTGIGYAAIINNTTGNKNTGLGYLADVLVSNLNYATAIGAESFVGCNNCLALGGTTNSSVFVGINNPTPTSDLHIKQKSDVAGNTTRGIKLSRSNGSNYWRTYVDGSSFLTFEYNDLGTGNWAWINTTGDFISGSDQSIKKDITPMNGVLDKIKLLQPKTYHYLYQEESDPLKFGFIAQQVEALFPEFVSTREDGLKGLAYQDFGVIAIKAIQEQQIIIEDLQRQINDLKALIQK